MKNTFNTLFNQIKVKTRNKLKHTNFKTLSNQGK